MTQSLHYRPARNNGHYIAGIRLRDILQEKFGYPARLSMINITYLEGLKDAGITEALDLINAILTYSVIEIYLEN